MNDAEYRAGYEGARFWWSRGSAYPYAPADVPYLRGWNAALAELGPFIEST